MKKIFLFLSLTMAVSFTMRADDTAPDASSVYLDPSAPLDDRVKDLISKMTLQEKADELCHFMSQNDRLHIPPWGGWNQGLHGVWSKEPTTLFPVSIALAASWDPDLVHDEADAISDEARGLYNAGADGVHKVKFGLVYRCPVINISRDPRWGRIQECYGEDPCLTGRLGTAYIKGLQGDDPKYLKVAATLKHYAINNQEKDRLSLSATVPERMFYEYWLAHWRECVMEGHPASLMAAYNAINGTPCAVNKLLLTDILRGQWGFDGFVVSDLDGIKHLVDGHHLTDKPEEAVAQALLAGCDYDDIEYSKYIPTAVQQGLITEDVVNTALSRVLRVAFRLGAFDPADQVPFSKIPATVVNSEEHRQLALKAEQEAIVLLANKQNFLPLDKSNLKSVAVIGPAAEQPEYGSYYGAKPKTVGPLEGLQDKLGSGVTVQYAKGCGIVDKADPALIAQAVDLAKSSDLVVLCLGSNAKVEAETRDRSNLELPGAQEQLLEAVVQANPKTVLVLFNAGPLSLDWASQNAPAILEAWYPGEEGGNALADVLFGDYNPGGKLPYTAYESLEQVPPQTEYDITKGFTYMYYPGKPTFPFGFGLSYTNFTYSNLKISSASIAPDQNQTVAVDVQNSGRIAGDEIVQLYIHQEKCSVPQPIEKLADFQRIHLGPGETKTVNLTIKPISLSIYDVNRKAFVVEPGTFDVLVGSSSQDIRQQGHFESASP